MIVFSIVLAAALSAQQFAIEGIDQRLAGADALVGLPRFAASPSGETKFTPNPRFWAKGVDFSCVSPWNSVGGSQRGGTLISKRHIVFAKHFPIPSGTRILFADAEGAVCPCYVEKTASIADTDIMIGSLNAEVTPNIHPAKILPPDAEMHLGGDFALPVVTFNQKDKLSLTELYLISTNTFNVKWQFGRASTNKTWNSFRETIISGDSGKPAFLLFGDQPILLYCLKTGGCGAGPAIGYYRREIQAAMDELCPGYKLESFDFAKVRCGDGK